MAAAKATVDALNKDSSKTIQIANTSKRDELIQDEKRFQRKWAEDRVFEVDAPTTKEFAFGTSPDELWKQHPKFYGTMAYPYMNGTLHAGHSFTVTKVEFAVGVARMQGRRSLYPQGYHCTGMPIKACADKLVREIEMFGNQFERCPETAIANGADESAEPPAPTQVQTKEDVTKFTTKKSKAAAKQVKMKYQFQIMLALGIPIEDIQKFADPLHWMQYFPPLCQRDLTSFGCRIDWRRSMVTTDSNPYYDAFVRWQMNRLKDLGKIKFGKRYTIYSPKDGQACMDHDRSEGEGVGVQEYTTLKLRVKEWPEAAKSKLEGKLPSGANVYFVPATLRPETMYGQTCCFVGPSITYGIYEAAPNEYFFISQRAARNMSFQSIFAAWGEFPKVAELLGSDVIGTLVHAPLSVHKNGVRILPMETVKASKGTGVVSCVPSDSPDDYATVMDLAKKADYYKIKKEWVELEILPVIKTPAYGDLTAKFLVESMKINSPKDVKQLAEAKDLAYREGFYKGVMVYGDFKGDPVSEAKDKVKQQLLDAGDAFNYAEPDGFVLSRSGDDCVAAHLDQWYLNYGTTENGGDGEWQKQVLEYVSTDGLNTFSSDVKNAIEQALGWLSQWACARSYGLGSKLPWDPKFLVESLSDSTVYMAYYTIAHLLHKDIFGRETGPANVKVDQMTDEVWDYIFTRTQDVKTDIPKESLETMRREFEYWYPLDLRVSGKDLLQNHLIFFLYGHVALFPKAVWPKAMRANGHLVLNSEKMSKSTGNFLSLKDAIDKFGADATRITMADAGDTMDDANFDETVANSTILRMYELREWCKSMIKEATFVKSREEYAAKRDSKTIRNADWIQRTGPRIFLDDIFEDEMNGLVHEATKQYDGALYKAALKTGLYDFIGARDAYREGTKAGGIGMHADLVRRYIELQALMITPVAPHWAEYIWTDVLEKPTSIQITTFPVVPEQDPALAAAREYSRSTATAITSTEGAQMKKLAKGKASAFNPKEDKKVTIFVAQKFPAWQDNAVQIVRELFKNMTLDIKAVSQKLPKADTKKAMPFITGLKRRLEAGEPESTVFGRKLPFDELAVLKETCVVLKQAVQKCMLVEIVSVEEGGKTGMVVGGTEGIKEGEKREGLPAFAEFCEPGKPSFNFENV